MSEAAEAAWQKWYEPETDWSKFGHTSTYDEMHRAFLAAYEAGAARRPLNLTELTAEALNSPTPRMLKILNAAEELGWTAGRVTVCVRLSKPDDKPDRVGAVALPMYASWELRGWTPRGKPSWTFISAAAANLQPLSEGDVMVYLADPSVVYPEPPEETA